MKCKAKTEVYSRVVGYYRPVQQWNRGKQEEYQNRKTFSISTAPAEEEPHREAAEEVRDLTA